MDRYCKFFIVLLTLTTIIASRHCAENIVTGLAVNVSVSIKSQMGPNTDLHVHCASDPASSTALPGVDYGEHNLVNDEVYNLSFLRQSSPHFDKIIIWCHFLSIGFPPKDVAVYYGLYYPDTNCPCLMESGVERSNWTVSPTGFFCRSSKQVSMRCSTANTIWSTVDGVYNLLFLRQSSPHFDKIIIHSHILGIGFAPKDVGVHFHLCYPNTKCLFVMESGVEGCKWTVTPAGTFCRSSKVGPWY